jgi:molecular chaperone IbpA
MAVAGFKPEELDITAKEGTLTVAGKAKPDADQPRSLYRGIARRAFERRFQLADFIQVKSASLENGLLNVELERVVPEALKPRKIEIGSGNGAKPIEQKAA